LLKLSGSKKGVRAGLPKR